MKKAIMTGVLFLTAIIWGGGFTVQSAAMKIMEPVSFNGLRLLLGGLFLLPVSAVLARVRKKRGSLTLPAAEERKVSVQGGLISGVMLFLATAAQQAALVTVPSGKTGFLTALYIVLVPVFGALLGQRQHKIIWLCVVLDVIGFRFLSIQPGEGLTIEAGAWLGLASAACYAVQILLLERYAKKGADGVTLTCAEFLFAGVLSLPVMFLTEHPTLAAVKEAVPELLYVGVVSGGIGFSLQAVAESVIESAPAALIMSLESVFSLISGWLFLNERLSSRELAGCALVFTAVLLSELPGLIAWQRKKRAAKTA